jgi:hypothetical protein
LNKLIAKAIFLGVKHTIFREPDINNEITAIAFETSDVVRKITGSLPLLSNTN